MNTSTMDSPATLSTAEAQAILAPFNCLVPQSLESPAQKAAVQQAVLHLTSVTDTQMLGILADTWAQGIQALHAYAKALNLTVPSELVECEGPVYIKFNPRSHRCYASPYS
ncbi:MAG TPA: DUF1824 family protein, partial [Stenomitos sp.]